MAGTRASEDRFGRRLSGGLVKATAGPARQTELKITFRYAATIFLAAASILTASIFM